MTLVKINYLFGGNDQMNEARLKYTIPPKGSLKFNIYDFNLIHPSGVKVSSTRAARSTGELISSWFKEVFTGSSIDQFLGKLTNTTDTGKEVILSSSLPCKILSIKVKKGQRYRFRADQFVACTPDVIIDTKLNVTFTAYITGQTLAMAEYSTESAEDQFLWVYGFNMIEQLEVPANETKSISKGLFLGNVNTCDTSFDFGVTLIGGFRTMLQIKGPCTIYIQYGDFDDFLQLLQKHIKVPKPKAVEATKPQTMKPAINQTKA